MRPGGGGGGGAQGAAAVHRKKYVWPWPWLKGCAPRVGPALKAGAGPAGVLAPAAPPGLRARWALARPSWAPGPGGWLPLPRGM
jgi:hypothetical protein